MGAAKMRRQPWWPAVWFGRKPLATLKVCTYGCGIVIIILKLNFYIKVSMAVLKQDVAPGIFYCKQITYNIFSRDAKDLKTRHDLFLRLELAVRDHVVVLVRGVDVFLHGSRGVHLDHLEASAEGEGESRGGVADSEELARLERRLLSWNAKRRRPARTSVAGWSPRRRRRLRKHRAGT